MLEDRQFFAYHEAGHAVVAMLQGMSVYLISIEPSEDVGGITDLQKIGISLRKLREFVEFGTLLEAKEVFVVEQHVRMSLAGEIAQYRFAPESVRDFHARSDMEFLKLLNPIAGSECEVNAWIKLLHIQTEQLIFRNWNRIDVIAKTLLERQKMTGEEVLDVLRNTCDPAGSRSVFQASRNMTLQVERRFCASIGRRPRAHSS